MVRSVIYHAKRLLHKFPWLYSTAYNIATFNPDYLWQRLNASQYPSDFGGLWTDRKDFAERLEVIDANRGIKEEAQDRLETWRTDGYIKIEAAVDPDLIDKYLEEVKGLKSLNPSPLFVTSASLDEPVPYRPEVLQENLSPRTVDDYFYSKAARELLFHPAITEFLELVFEKPAILTQSLNFERGSEQALHLDTAFVRMNSPRKLIGVWIALEDIQPGTGELLYYPGSHRWPDYKFSGRFKHYDEERDGPEQMHNWLHWIHEEAERRGTRVQSFLPAKGDLLIWHADLAHGGAPISDPESTRRSLVGHYCPVGVRPLYHYYKPAQRRRHHWRDHLYFSSYYR